VDYIRRYHDDDGIMSSAPSFEELLPFLPRVFEKIAGNVECYLKDLEADKVLAGLE